ncbi:hypothetical protein [Nostoc sp. UHCC 0870]|uniref:hypothetical protein n=1 Tax=Nostoc sp. UHCC 0870 TaxID=2914041 RepID=UPI001EE15079|nr:hypothetical protein [Nostoc sp. UHCC 0870]UKO98534.1 hypothetical protein L6494_02005 [Nostoc sp. UHCC 0870]
MTREKPKPGQVKASEAGKEKILEKIQEKEWTKGDDSEALTVASQKLFKKKIENFTDDKEQINIEELKKRIKSKLIFNDYTYQSFLDEIEKIESKNNKITINKCLEIIESKNVRFKGISYNSSWKKFYNGNYLDKDIFKAYWDALELGDWRDYIDYPENSPYEKSDRNSEKLLTGLSLFNHKSQIKLLEKNFPDPTLAFLISKHPCSFSQIWLLRRLEAEIKTYNPKNFKVYSLNNTLYLESKKIIRLQDIKSVVDTLDFAHIIYTCDIDQISLQELQNYLQIYENLIEYIKNLPTIRPGKIFIYFLVGQNANNNCYQELKSKQEKLEIIELHQTSIDEYQRNNLLQDEVSDILPKIAAHLNKGKLSDEEKNIAAQLIKEMKNEITAEKLLKVIYRYFNCYFGYETTTFAKWTNYP